MMAINQGEDIWMTRIAEMNADLAFMRWLRVYLPQYETEYSGDLLGMYDAWAASRAGRCATCRWAEVRTVDSVAIIRSAFPLTCVRTDAESEDDPDASVSAMPWTSEWGGMEVKPEHGCVMWEAKP